MVEIVVSPTLQPVDSFDAATHTYYRNLMVVPGLSQILRETGVVSMDGIPVNILNRKRDLGHAVHSACEMYDRGQEFDTLHEAVQPYFNAYVQFRTEHECKWQEIEQFHISDVGEHGTGIRELFGCTPDRIGEIDGSGFAAVLEIKCTYKVEKHHQVQTAMQGVCISPFNLYEHHPRFVLYLDKTGKYKLDEHKEHSRDLLAARQIISTWYWAKYYRRGK